MIRQLLKRDQAWRWVPALTLAALVFAVLWRLVSNAAGTMGFQIAFYIPAFLAVGVVATQESETRLLASWPVTVRQVYLARLLAMCALLWLPVTAVVGVSLAMEALAVPGPSAPMSAMLESVSITTLAILALQAAGIRGFAVPRTLIFWLVMMSSSFTGWRTSTAGTIALPLVAPVCWIVLIMICVSTWLSVPKTFQSAPLKMSLAVFDANAPAATALAQSQWKSTWLPALRSLYRWNGFEFLILFVLMAAGSFRPLMLLLFSWAWRTARPSVRWLIPLPVHRRVLLAAILLPAFLAFAGGYVVSVHLPSFPGPYSMRGISVRASQSLPGWPGYRQEQDCKTLNVLPPVDFWALANHGRAPLIESPWGETFQPPMVRKDGFYIYNPWAVGCENSQRFLDWQFTRATMAVYGRPLSRGESDDWDVPNKHVAITSMRTQVVTVGFISALAMLALILTLLNDWRRFRQLSTFVRRTILSAAGVLGYAVVMLDATDKFVLSQWALWALPRSFPAAAGVVIACLAMLCWVVNVLFRQVELTDRPAAVAP